MPDCNLYEDSKYFCTACKYEMSNEQVGQLEQDLSASIEDSYNDKAEVLKSILDEHKDTFHPQHYLILLLKWLLINLYGRRKEYQYPILSQDLIQDKLDYCQDYLQAMDVIDPGLSHNRGLVLWEIYSVKAFILSQQFTSGQISKSEFKTEISEFVPLLQEVRQCLEYICVPGTVEGQVYKMALRALVNTKETLTFIDLM